MSGVGVLVLCRCSVCWCSCSSWCTVLFVLCVLVGVCVGRFSTCRWCSSLCRRVLVRDGVLSSSSCIV